MVNKFFGSKIKKVGDCFLYLGYKDKDGYGTLGFLGKSRRAHRVSYYLEKGDIPKGMMIDHTCRNRSCVNINHLRLVTPKQNSLENSASVAAVNAEKTHCKLGHKFDRKYGKQRYCSQCQAAKSKRLYKSRMERANKIMC